MAEEERQVARAFVLLADEANKTVGYQELAELDVDAVFDYLQRRECFRAMQPRRDLSFTVNLETLLKAEELPEGFRLALSEKHVENLVKKIDEKATEHRQIGAMWSARFYREAVEALYGLAKNKTLHEGTRMIALTEIVDKMVIPPLCRHGHVKPHMSFLHGLSTDAEQPLAIKQAAEQGLKKGARRLADTVNKNLGRCRIDGKMVCEDQDIIAFLMATEYLPADVKPEIWEDANKAFGDDVVGKWIPAKDYEWGNVPEKAKARMVYWLAENTNAPIVDLFQVGGLPENTRLKLVERLERNTEEWCKPQLATTVPYCSYHRRYVNEFVERLEGIPDEVRLNAIKILIQKHAKKGLFATVIDFANDVSGYNAEIAEYARQRIEPAALNALDRIDAAFEKCIRTMWNKSYWPGLGGTYTLAKMKDDANLPENVRNAATAMIEKLAERTFEALANIDKYYLNHVLRDLALAPHAPMEYRIKAGLMAKDVNWMLTDYPDEVRIAVGLKAVEKEDYIPRLAEIATHADAPEEVRTAAKRRLGIENIHNEELKVKEC